MSDYFDYEENAERAISITLIESGAFDGWLEKQNQTVQAWVSRQKFTASIGTHCWVPGDNGEPERVVAGWNGEASLATIGALPMSLPEGLYTLEGESHELALLGWGLGAYRFERYRESDREPARLVLGSHPHRERIANTVAATHLTRDLINTPAGDMLPSNLADEAMQVANTHDADCTVTVGDDLLDTGHGAIHAVGRASANAPRLIDIRWGNPKHPRVVVIGKGVCFDSGGLDIKPASGMRTMKKDMGGAATALGLAQLIMAQQLPINLRLMIPAVENAISGTAYRPGDVLNTYKGISVEVDNTDAEGRLVLCDALALAAEDEPALIIDYATLTGSARSAVGAEIAAMFCNDDEVAQGIHSAGAEQDDPVWRMPLHAGYAHMLKSKVADTANSAASPYGGAITAALFLEQFVEDVPWAHFDIMAFNVRNRPGRPEGGEAMALRAVYCYLEKRFGPGAVDDEVRAHAQPV